MIIIIVYNIHLYIYCKHALIFDILMVMSLLKIKKKLPTQIPNSYAYLIKYNNYWNIKKITGFQFFYSYLIWNWQN